MMESEPRVWGVFLLLVGFAWGTGRSVSARLPWSDEARISQVPAAVAFGLGPFLAGLAMMGAMIALPGQPRWTHAAVVVGLLAIGSIPNIFARKAICSPILSLPWTWRDRMWATLLVAWIMTMVCSALIYPLTQNDSLEYMIVGREVLHSGSLACYPLLDSESSVSGFYAPWTHPPLYVSLIALIGSLKGDLIEPGLARLLAPWAAIGAVAITFCVGRLHSRTTGLVAANLLIATPLFILGADSATADAFFVLGTMLLIATVTSISAGPIKLGAIVGGMAGVVVYAHSAAFSAIPIGCGLLILMAGLGSWRTAASSVAAFLTMALILGAWPYLHNLRTTGAVVGDNPEVFRLLSLCWSDYFSVGRGIGDLAGIIQYGWLKGWFAVESLGLAWWLMLPAILWTAAIVRVVSRGIVGGFRSLSATERILMLSGATVAAFLAAAIATSMLGHSLLIKNERYFLIIQPCVAILAGATIAHLTRNEFGNTIVRKALHLANPVLLGLLAVSLPAMAGYRLSENWPLQGLWKSSAVRLENRPRILAVRFLDTSTEPGTIVLTMVPADMYYTSRRMISYLDPRLTDFYASTSSAEAVRHLKALGVSYLHLVDYGLPSFGNSQTQAIARNPSLSSLRFQSDGNQIYKLVPEDAYEEVSLQDLLHPEIHWQRGRSFIIGGRKRLLNTPDTDEEVCNVTTPCISGGPIGLFGREWSTLLKVGKDAPLIVSGETQYAIDLRLRGSGFVRLWIEQYDGQQLIQELLPRSKSRVLLGEAFLGSCSDHATISRRLFTLPDANRVVLIVEQVGNSEIVLEHACLVQVQRRP